MKSIKEIMTKGVECVSPDTPVVRLAETMKSLDVGSLPICENDRLTGMVTDRDIVVKVLAEGRDPAATKASEIMSAPITYCFEDQDIGEAARIMEAKQVRRLVVLSREKRLVGIISLGNLVLKGGSSELVSEVLEKVSEPGKQKVA
jgi:CBS domain-containing protein